MLAAALLGAAALQLGWRIAGRASLASRILPLPAGQPPFATWAARLWLSFALPALLALLLLGRLDALWRLPAEFDAATALARRWGRFPAWPILLGAVLGSVLGAAASWWRGRRGKRPFQLGRPAALPARGQELPGALWLALSAGVAEELYFRLALPLVVTLATGSALLGVAVASVAFGLLHRYQGWVGVLATTAAGAFLAFVYLGSGRFWLAVLCHALIDVNGLVVRPALAWRARGAG